MQGENYLWSYCKSYELGKKKPKEFESSLHGGCQKTISRFIIKIDAAKKGIVAGGKILDPELYAWTLTWKLLNSVFEYFLMS